MAMSHDDNSSQTPISPTDKKDSDQLDPGSIHDRVAGPNSDCEKDALRTAGQCLAVVAIDLKHD